MRLAKSVCLAFTITCATALVAAEEGFPYKAFIAENRTQLHSGPGDDHYATDELRRGDEVEVHRRAEGGWLAIRPPAASFSWVSQRDVKVTGDVGEIVGTAAVSWIGSSVGDVSDHLWLIKLVRGESVVVIGKERRRVHADGKSDVYYKIAPPAGEFRWVHEDDVVREKSELVDIKDPDVALADFRVPVKGSPRSTKATTTAPEPTPAAAPAEPEAPAKKDGFSSRDKSAAGRGTTTDLALIPKRKSGPKPDAKADVAINATLDSRLRDLDAQLSMIAAQPAESWDFSVLRASAEQLLTGGQSTLDRARVQLFLDKLAEFDGLKSRHALMAPKPTSLATTLSKPSTLAATSTPSSKGLDPRFDGVGWLLPVHSSKKSSPPYALLDKDGNILQFVSPAPGLNLNRYLRKEIGVFGQKDQPTTLDKPHLTAHRIVELDRHRK